jgi:DivIVA domain-containing protein
MTLTPEAVRNKQFTTIRLREGYDMGEVDHFLDQVEQELQRLIDENEALRQQGAKASTNGQKSTPTAPEPAPSPSPRQSQARADVEAEKAAAASSATTPAGASTVAVRILEKAATAADELVAEASEQAEQVLAEAKSKAAQLESNARTDAERITTEARGNAARLDAEAKAKLDEVNRQAETRRTEVIGKLEADRDALAHSVEELQQFEREYRARLKLYFTEQLQALETSEDGTAAAGSRRTGTSGQGTDGA